MAVPALLQLCVLPFVPESPRYLLIDKNDVAGAEKGNPKIWFKVGGASIGVSQVLICLPR